MQLTRKICTIASPCLHFYLYLMIPTSDTVNDCAWAQPGANRFTGDVPAAVERYSDIPADVRKRLRERMAEHDYDDVATISADDIQGRNAGYSDLREMHFGAKQVCRRVSRPWKSGAVERGLVYCEGENCLIVPTVCSNVARVTRRMPETMGTIASIGTSPTMSELPAAIDPPSVLPLNSTTPAVTPLTFADAAGIGAGPHGIPAERSPAAPPPWLGIGNSDAIPNGGGIALIPDAPIVAVPEPSMMHGLFAGAFAWLMAALARRRRSV